MSDPQELGDFATKSYRYLRLSIVVVVLAVIASVLIERWDVGCWKGSISAYYYTPVQLMFVGGLFAIGVSLIAIRGSTNAEDVLLNVAGVLAPIVAFVPTDPPKSTKAGFCGASAHFVGGNNFVDGSNQAVIDNNVPALAIGGAIAIVLTVGLALSWRKATIKKFDPWSIAGLVVGVVLLAVGIAWYAFFRENFLSNAHAGAAIAMFFFIWVAMVFNAFSAQPKRFRKWYAGTAVAMVVFALFALVGKRVDSDWRHQILWLELLELGAFSFYWFVQTLEHWEEGVPTGGERLTRATDSRPLKRG